MLFYFRKLKAEQSDNGANKATVRLMGRHIYYERLLQLLFHAHGKSFCVQIITLYYRARSKTKSLTSMLLRPQAWLDLPPAHHAREAANPCGGV
jgi:hypothetical protein